MEEKEIEVALPTSKKSIVFACIGLGLMCLTAFCFITILLAILGIFTIIPGFVFSLLGLIFGIKDKRKPAIIMSSIALSGIVIAATLFGLYYFFIMIGIVNSGSGFNFDFYLFI